LAFDPTSVREAARLRANGLRLARGGRLLARLADFELTSGKAALLVGPSGVGKTTALFTLAGLLPPAAGEVRVDDAPFSALLAAERDRLRGRRIGLVFQDAALVAGLTVQENVLVAPFAAGAPQDRARAEDLLGRLGLAGVLSRPAERLSRGQAQRVAIARALYMRPSVLLVDEPTASLDDAHAAQVAGLLAEAARETGAAMVIATHDGRLRARFPRMLTLEAVG